MIQKFAKEKIMIDLIKQAHKIQKIPQNERTSDTVDFVINNDPF